MQWFRDLKIRYKLIFGFSIVSAITITVGLVGIFNMSRINDMADKMYESETLGLSDIKEANINLIYMARAEKNMILSTNRADREKHRDNIGKYQKVFETYLTKATPKIHTQEGKELLRKLNLAWKEYEEIQNKIIEITMRENLNERRESAELSMGLARQKIEVVDNLLTEISKRKEQNAKNYSEETTTLYQSSRLFMILLILGSVAMGIAIGLFIANNISRSINQGLAFSGQLSKGDLTARIQLDQKDELGQLATALNLSADNMENLISNIIVSSQNLSQAVEQIASGNQNLSQRTSEQASALEEVASTIEEATAAINQNAENAIQARGLTEKGAEKSVEGKKVALDAVSAIKEMNESSVKIGEIISVINDIAFQTNLLALNAAVEAARAGEQGRGFAVVAGEVRNLAQRSGNAAKEIESLIKDTVAKVGNSTVLVENTGSALAEIAESARTTAQIIAEIAAASQEQKQGIGQINTAVSEMDNMTQQNASLVEETASASEEMANQAQDLMEMVQRFNISDTLRGDTYNKKHREVHITGAETKKIAGAGGNGRKAQNVPVAPTVAAKSENMKDILKQEGFEEF